MDYLRDAQHHADQAAKDLRDDLLNCALYELKLAAASVKRLLDEQELSQ